MEFKRAAARPGPRIGEIDQPGPSSN